MIVASKESASDTESPLASSFRDPNGSLFASQGRIFRILNAAGLEEVRAFMDSPVASKWISSGRLVQTAALGPPAQDRLLEDPRVAQLYARARGVAIVEHERIPFASFPYEWPPEMLHAAAVLTLEFALELLPGHFGLKDATPYNVLFKGPRPVFIDLLSVEPRAPGDPVWLPYAQFIRTFLLPLLANRRLNLDLDQLLFSRRDGINPEEVYGWLGPVQRLLPPFLSIVSLPVWLASRGTGDENSLYRKRVLPDPAKARFVLRSMLRGLLRKTAALRPTGTAKSVWAGYMEANQNNYSADHFEAKERFVAGCLHQCSPKRVLDVGCNTGHFSRIAARAGASVVAIDYDPAVAGAVWRQAAAENLDVLPLVVNLTRPTPGVGWRNAEWPSFLDRARCHFDMVLMLAVIHHMIVTERVPLDEIIDLAAQITTGWLIIEFVSPEDSMFQRLVRGRQELYRDLTPEVFEASCRRRFEILRTQHLEGKTRRMYLLRRNQQG